MSPIRIRSIPWRDWPLFIDAWTALLLVCPHDSFFLSPAWISAWLEIYGAELSPELLFFYSHSSEQPVGACLLVRRPRGLGVPLRSFYLNCSGEEDADTTYIEYNALVTQPDFELQVAEALAGHIQGMGWDRVLILGAAPQQGLTKLSDLLGRTETETRPCYYVDLAQLRQSATPYAQAISQNTRKQNSFTRRHLEASFGPCVLDEARTPVEAEEFFTQLGELHNASWQARDKPGMFASRRFVAFHRKLIGALFSRGEIILTRLRAGEKIIAVLYCFHYRRRVYFYQSGIFYGDDKRLRPGFLALTLAIERLQQCGGWQGRGADEFDFLAGDAQYKKSLGTGQRELHWITVWAPSISSNAFRALKFIKGAIESQVG